MPADSFVGIWKFVARPNLCGTPRLREAATTLVATRRQRSANWQSRDNGNGKTCEAVRAGKNNI